MTLAEKIFTLRRKNGLSQDDLANELGVSRQAVYKWESGSSTPEIDKIRMLSKLFKVSFDYLLNDEIDDLKPTDDTDAQSNHAQINYRTVFRVAEAQNEKQSSIDHGFIKSKRDKSMAEAYFHRRMTAANKALNEVGVSERVFFKPTETTAWFYDETRRTIGFYYAGKIQLVCPIENIIEFNTYGGGQAAVNIPKPSIGLGISGGAVFGGGISVGRTNHILLVDKASSGVLTYYDGGDIKEFTITLNPNDDYMIETVAVDHGMDLMYILYGRNRASIEKNLDLIKQKIQTLKAIASTSKCPVADIDVDFYSELNKKLVADYVNFQKRILNPDVYVNKNSARVKDDPNRIKLDQTVPERPKSEEELLKTPLTIMGIVLAVIFIVILFFS